ncbi:hypothetical protein JS530_01145 [Bifidobacterium sp. LC6]|uniref:Uncharacterized protein n=1 Tax=Bifidobacterium colobi TaxID=2809026 RepID=A0ABS5UT49_9BIFI|nr:hypothetical protein [Bifidobacterium colobi]MBT1174134.1 hypothetical protein [Bifidobacterium colobi]
MASQVSVLELDRVLMEQPDTVEQHRQGLQVARRRRLHDIESKLIQLNSSIAESAERMRKQKLLHPFAVDSSLNHLDAVNAQLA